MHYIDMVKGLH